MEFPGISRSKLNISLLLHRAARLGLAGMIQSFPIQILILFATRVHIFYPPSLFTEKQICRGYLVGVGDTILARCNSKASTMALKPENGASVLYKVTTNYH